jgi:hypothetical protein
MDVGADFYTVHIVCSCFLIRCWSIDTTTARKGAKIGVELPTVVRWGLAELEHLLRRR